MDGKETGFMFSLDSDFPRDVTLLDGVVEMQNDKFKRVTLDDNFYAHHFLALDMGKPQKPSFTCNNGQWAKYVPLSGSVVMGSAAEDAEAHYSTKTIAGKSTGYHIKKNGPIIMNVGKPADYLDASPVFVPVTACDPGLTLPRIISTSKDNARWSLTSNGIIAAEDSLLYIFRGRMQGGGSNVEVAVNDKSVCDSRALYGGPGHVGKTHDGKKRETIRNMVTCSEGVVVKKGDKITLNANYDLEAHPAREGGHGGMLGGLLGSFLGGGGNMADQMAVMIFFVAPLNQ